MRKLLPLLLLVVAMIWPQTVGHSGITCTLPNNLQNGTTADATQVMGNFNTITGCFQNNIAASGANNDITGLFALTTALAPVNGGTPWYIGSNSTGSANAQVVSTTTPTNFVLQGGRGVIFTTGLTNTGATTINVASTGAVNVFKRTPAGPVALAGGELVGNTIALIVYDGTQWELMNPVIGKTPTISFLTAGTNATFTTPAGAVSLELYMLGGGGGGAGGAPGSNAGGNGGDTCWNTTNPACTTPIYDAGGGVGASVAQGNGGTGGVTSGTSLCDIPIIGGDGVQSSGTTIGSMGGSSSRAGAGAATYNTNGSNGKANTGGGAAGGSGSSGGGGGGGAGATCIVTITNPAATYIYTIGVGGTSGAGAANGGVGGTGSIAVRVRYF